jgi:hypothetical protein
VLHLIASAFLALVMTCAMLFLNWGVVPGILFSVLGDPHQGPLPLLADLVICMLVGLALMYVAMKRRPPHGIAIAAFMAFAGWAVYFLEAGFFAGMTSGEYPLWYEIGSFFKYPAEFCLALLLTRRLTRQAP